VTIGDVLETLRAITVDDTVSGNAARDAVVSAIVYDSRRATEGSLFVALRGLKADGATFVTQAAARGAKFIVAETPRPETVTKPWLVVSDARLALALLADAFYGHPSQQMPVIGITGTNGKTTTAYLLASMLDAAGSRAGLLGTVAYRVGTEEREALRTTPEAPEVQRLLRDMLDQGCRSAVMEVSSHALALRRVDGVRFAAGVFSNRTRDHLDFHEDMEAYFAAKRRLFEMLPDDAPGVINIDDPRGAALVEVSRKPMTYALTQSADVTPGPLDITLQGLSFDVHTPAGVVSMRSSLVGRPNVYNILAATATAVAIGLPLDAIAQGVGSLAGVPGRFEVVSAPGDEVTVVVDYAHTDDALRNLLETARPLARRRLITVFGCGGDRDRTKRPLMGMVAARLSDVVVITSDNPRSEDPVRIIDEIKRGIPAAGQTTQARTADVRTIVDRGEAIERAVTLGEPGDVVLIAGKGHEKYQQIGDRVLPFDDAELARTALARRRPSASSGQSQAPADGRRRPSKAG
jgi:UDP-N-acetylmuramoyl-L-alanyl-D-glutamate--2,6-diaminopimelate ligase